MEFLYYSFIKISPFDYQKSYLLDIKIPARCARDAVAILIFYEKMLFVPKRIKKRILEFPNRDKVERSVLRVLEFDRVGGKGKTVHQFKLKRNFNILEIIKEFPK